MLEIDERIHIAIRSYKRPGGVTTLKSVPWASIWVPESQEEEYRECYGDKVITIPDEEDGNPAKKFNAVLNRSPKPWTLILDDDITAFSMWEDGEGIFLDHEQVARLINHHFDLADQIGVKLWGINQLHDGMAYRQFTPFSFLTPILGPFTGHLEPVLRFDESIPAKEDYDFWLQNIEKYHRTLRVNKYAYRHDHGNKKGGFVSTRTMKMEKECVQKMIDKWGPKIFKAGGTSGLSKDRETNPNGNIMNSLVQVPIPGI